MTDQNRIGWEQGIKERMKSSKQLADFIEHLATETPFVVEYNKQSNRFSCNVSLEVFGRKLSLFQFKHDGTGQMPEPAGEFDGYTDVSEDSVQQVQRARLRCRRKMNVPAKKGSRSHFSPSVVNCGADKQLAQRCCSEYADELVEIDAQWRANRG